MILQALTLTSGVILYLSLLASSVSTEGFWLLGVLAIGFPEIYLTSTGFALYLLSRKQLRSILLMTPGLLVGLVHLPSFLGWHPQERGQLRVLSMNCRYFDALRHPQTVKANIDESKQHLEALHPDIICTQDWSTSTGEDNQRIESFVQMDLGLPYFIYRFPSMAIYSREPWQDYHGQVFPSTFNAYCAVDLPLEGRTVRVYNLHLESYQFERAPSWGTTARNSLGRLQEGLKLRSQQAQLVAADIATCPYPVVVCGDFNDVPTSYAYREILGPLQDGFRARGQGLGFTYQGPIPGLRIDYILCSQQLRFTRYQNLKGPAFLDHKWVYAEFNWADTSN